MKIGLLGGTFDPIHMVHLMVAEYVHEATQLDEIWFMPTHIPPHKQGRKILRAEDRLEMVRLATEEIPYFKAFSFELEREGRSYTIDTIKDLKRSYPELDFHFIIGGDMMDYLPHWAQIDQLVNMIQFIGVPRPGYVPQNDYAKKFVKLVPMPLMDISSSFIRERLARGESIRFLVPEIVRKYIEVNELYGA